MCKLSTYENESCSTMQVPSSAVLSNRSIFYFHGRNFSEEENDMMKDNSREEFTKKEGNWIKRELGNTKMRE